MSPPARFDYEAPGLLRLAVCVLRRGDLRECSRASIIDHGRGERYTLKDDEEMMLDALRENIFAICGNPLDRLDWSPEKTAAARDDVLEAIAERRHGDPRRWEILAAWSGEEWLAWLRSLTPPGACRASSARR